MAGDRRGDIADTGDGGTGEDDDRRQPAHVDLSGEELTDRAAQGVFLTSSWGIANLVIGFAGSLVLARLLTPEDFGLVAIGATALLVGIAVADGGLLVGIVRRETPPTPGELSDLLGIQLVFTCALTLVGCAIALSFGTVGAVTAVILLALPLTASQTIGRAMLTRKFDFKRLTILDAAGQIANYGWSIPAVLLGFGVWGMATGYVARAAAGMLLLPVIAHRNYLRPSLGDPRKHWDLIWFGLRFQPGALVLFLRDIVLNVVVAGIGGVATLGIWSLARRILELPLVLFTSLWRVVFPIMARLVPSGETAGTALLVERSVRVSCVAGAVALASLAGSIPPLVEVVFGETWADAAPTIVWACIGVMISGSIGLSTAGYVLAAGLPSVTVMAQVALAVGWIGSTAALLPTLGVKAVGVGWIVGAVAEAAVLAIATRRSCGAQRRRKRRGPARSRSRRLLAGGRVGLEPSPGLPAALAGLAVGTGTTLAVLAVTARSALVESARLTRTAWQRAF